MNPLKLLIKETLYTKIISMIILLTVIIAVSVSVAVYTTSKASEDETRKIMREQGLNLFIFPKGTETIDFFSFDYSKSFDETYIDVLADSKTFDAVRHLVGILQVKYNWKDPRGSVHKIILTGYKDEAEQTYLPRQEKMGYDIKTGEVKIGYDIAQNIPEGQAFIITGNDGKKHQFKILERMAEGRGILDQGVAMNLHDLQLIIDMPGKINKIEALGCVCHDGRVVNARNQLSQLMPDVEVKELSSIANAREQQRAMMNKYGAMLIPLVIVGCLLITSFLFYQNIRSRKYEIGILMALGWGNKRIILLVISKAFIIGLLGAVIGFFVGFWIASFVGSNVFQFTAHNIKPIWTVFYASLILSPVLWMGASWIPALLATRIDPARTLSGE